jgi:hypothetical protein
VQDNATVFDGSTIETGKTSSLVNLRNGSRVELGTLSRGRLFRDHLILERGGGEFRARSPFRVEALSLRITPSGGDSYGRISVVDGRTVEVAAVSGDLRVASVNGVVLANIAPGMALTFNPQDAAPGTTTVTGCLQKSGDHYLLTDDTSNVVFEVQGRDAAKMAGRRVQITGSAVAGATPAAGATQVIQSSSGTSLAATCSVPPATGSADRSGKAGTGMTTASKAVIAGVIIGGVGTAIGVAKLDRGNKTGNPHVSPSAP